MNRVLGIAAVTVVAAWGAAAVQPPSAGAEPEFHCNFEVITIAADHDGQVIEGTSHADVISAAGHHDVTIHAGAGNGMLCSDDDGTLSGAGAGNVFDGGPGHDTVVFTPAVHGGLAPGVHVDARTGTATDDTGGVVRFTNMEGYVGTGGADTFVGTDRAETWSSELDGRYEYGGYSDVDMGGGNDTAYVVHPQRLDLGSGNDHAWIWNGGWVAAGSGNDVVNAAWRDDCDCRSNVPSRIWLGSGDDVFTAPALPSVGEGDWEGATPYDVVAGQSGHDTVDLAGVQRPIRADLRRGRATWEDGYANMTSTERFRGGLMGDRIYGTSGHDEISGRGGNDTIYGRGGNDWLHGDLGRDHLVGGPGHDTAWGGPRNDTCHTEVRHHC